MVNKVYADAHAALEELLFDGMTLMSGGFGLSGVAVITKGIGLSQPSGPNSERQLHLEKIQKCVQVQ